MVSCVAGSSTAKVWPLFAATHFPSMKSFRSLLKYAAAAELRAGLSVAMVIVILFQSGF
jgi:hypothetical protein